MTRGKAFTPQRETSLVRITPIHWLLFVVPLSVAATPDDPIGTNHVADVAEKVTPAVVNITTERMRRQTQMEGHPFFREFFGPHGGPRRDVGAGSGVVISADGYLVTNNHVVEGADEIKVSFSDRREYRAKLIGSDKPADIALLKIDANSLPFLGFGDSAKLRLGEYVLAVGNPFGVGQTVTMGIVSAKGRQNIGIVEYEDFIQTDAAINPGNSGGALVNMKGELIGINTAILSRTGGAAGIGFAVPSNMVQPLLTQIREHGRVRRGWLGVAIQDLSSDLAATLDLGKDVDGVLISDVIEDGPAAKSDLKSGDVIVNVNGRKTTSSAELKNTVAMLGPGAKAKVEIVREGKRRTLNVTLGEKKDEAEQAAEKSAETSVLSGLTLRDLSDELRTRLQVPQRLEGVLVTEVESGSIAEAAQLHEGDIITHVDRNKVRSVNELKSMSIDSKERVLLRVWRAGSNLFIVLRK
jgi:serine protease Do